MHCNIVTTIKVRLPEGRGKATNGAVVPVLLLAPSLVHLHYYYLISIVHKFSK